MFQVICRLPSLKSLDGVAITADERRGVPLALQHEATILNLMLGNACLLHKLVSRLALRLPSLSLAAGFTETTVNWFTNSTAHQQQAFISKLHGMGCMQCVGIRAVSRLREKCVSPSVPVGFPLCRTGAYG